MSSIAENLIARVLPPEVTAGRQTVVSGATGLAAASFDWVTALGAFPPQGQVFITVEAVGFDAYVRFGPTSTTGTTANNSLVVRAGQKERFYVNPNRHRFIDHLGLGVGAIKVHVSSPIGERLDI